MRNKKFEGKVWETLKEIKSIKISIKFISDKLMVEDGRARTCIYENILYHLEENLQELESNI